MFASIARGFIGVLVAVLSFFIPTEPIPPVELPLKDSVDTLELRQAAVEARKARFNSVNKVQNPQEETPVSKASSLPRIDRFSSKERYVGIEFANQTLAGTSTGTVVGYMWDSKEGINFASVRLPAWGLLQDEFKDRQYEVYIWQGDRFIFYQNARTVVDEIKFPEGGIQKFKVLGIDPKLGVCATDRNVTWGLTFSGSGQANLERTAITDDVPSPDCIKKYESIQKK